MPDGSKRDIRQEPQVRTMTLERLAGGEGQAKVYKASLSSELPYERWFGTEILSHDAEAINMERAERSLPLLFNHDMDVILGRIRNVRIEGRRLVGDLTFSASDAEAQRRQAQVDDGTLEDISVRYSIEEYETKTDEHGHDTVIITRWTPLEASIVTVPADHTVGVGRSKEAPHRNDEGVRTMPRTTETGEQPEGTEAGKVTVADLKNRRSAAERKGAQAAVQLERERTAGIMEVFALQRFQGDEFDLLRDQCIHDGTPVNEARALLLEMIDGLPENQATPTGSRQKAADEQPSRRPSTPATAARGPFVTAGATDAEKRSEGMERAILLRAGLLDEGERAKEGANQWKNYSLVEMAKEHAEGMGMSLRGLPKFDMLGRIFVEGRMRAVGMGTADFPAILANVANKQLLRGWEMAPATYREWTRKGTLTDFRQASRAGLSGYTLLEKVPEGGEIPYGKTADRVEYLRLDTFGRRYAITRQAVINDDLGALTRAPRDIGMAAARTVNKMVYDYLGLNSGTGPTLNQDGVVLFHTSHNNYDATSGGITVTNVDTGRTKMRKQTDPNNSEPLNISPTILMVPAALETVANVFVSSETDPDGRSGATGGAKQANPFYKKLKVVAEPALDGLTNGGTAWYLLADPELFDTVEVAFLDGNENPYFETQNGWSVDGIEMKARIDAAVGALDFRGVYRKRGA